ncbi:MAG: cysteine peptidase family C39 domain-containing protein [Lachnospiraceae bacterium]|nr:cysteine peptidase family C39 domain-containing protein [Lachnospiraceae bacterium]
MNKPIKNGIAKTPVVMQLEALECGAASLCMIFGYYGKWIPLEKVRIACGVSRNGANARNMLEVAEHYGLETSAYSYSIEQLKKMATFPCIIYWNFCHYVVLKGIKGDKAYINDPAQGAIVVPMSKFSESFTGITMCFAPTENFVPQGKEKSSFDFIKKRIKKYKMIIFFMSFLSIVISLFTLTTPIFQRVFLDRLLTGHNKEWTQYFFIVLIIFEVVYCIVNFMQAIYDYRVMGKIAVSNNANFMWRLLHKPMVFFSQRMSGDLINRQSSNETISSTIINIVVPLFFNIILMLICFVIMLRYNVMLACVAFVGIIVCGVLAYMISQKRKNITRALLVDTAKYYSTTVVGIMQIETIKANGAESAYFGKSIGLQAKTVRANQILLSLSTMFTVILQFVFLLFNQIILIIGVWFCMNDNLTVGMLLAFTSMFQMFVNPTMMIITSGQAINELKVQMERIDDVIDYPEDDVFAPVDERADSEEDIKKLSGDIQIKNITFGYGPLEPPVIKDFSLTIKPGQSIALVGGSGSGKSTIAKMISGIYKPWSGEILFDGKRFKDIQKDVFCSSVSVVDQEITLFADTIANNIKMWDKSIEDFEMILAARDAMIHDDIMKRPEGYQYRLSEQGNDFSGGQKQRIEIARMLAQDPSIVILDEATSALDTKTEYEIVKSIKNRGITSIVVAHRLSTIRDCDVIIVLEGGDVVDRGTHSELMERCERYRELVVSE